MDNAKSNREFLKGGDWPRWGRTETDQKRKVPMPALQKGYAEPAVKLELVPPERFTVGRMPIYDVINRRQSRRKYTGGFLTLEELSFLLWATQGIKADGVHRTVPSAGGRHPFETYLSIQRVKDVQPGLYRYLPLEHKLLLLAEDAHLAAKVSEACNGQKFAGEAAVTFIWTVIPYRTEWRYDLLASKVIAVDAGHLCQNLYLACEAIGCGTCAIGAYTQEKIDALLGVDGIDEFTTYIAPVGKVE